MWNWWSKGELLKGLDPDTLWPLLMRLRELEDARINERLDYIMSMIYMRSDECSDI